MRLDLILGSYWALLVSVVHYLQHDVLLHLLLLEQLLLLGTLVLLHQVAYFYFEIFLSLVVHIRHFQIIHTLPKHYTI